MKAEPNEKPIPLMSALFPPEMHEIAEQAVKDAHARTMSKKNQRKLIRAGEAMPDQWQKTTPLLAAMAQEVERSTTGHREKLAEKGDLMNPLIAWYCLVAKPIPRNLWSSMPKAQAAVDAEWAKLRACDGGRSTCDESTVCS